MSSPKASAEQRAGAGPASPDADGSPAPAKRRRRATAAEAAEAAASESVAKTRRGKSAGEADGAAPPPEDDGKGFDGQYRIDIPKAGFEGPLDLLLHLIQQHELDILDIPVGFVTDRFLAYLKMMRDLSIDIASEYLVMAATLVHIKSKMLLPVVPSDQDDGLPAEEEEDPRAELVRRLLEYQKYKAAAAEIAERGTLGKDIFPRGAPEPTPEGPAPFAQLGVFSLLDAFEKLLKRSNVKIEHQVAFDRISITDRIVELTEHLSFRKKMTFEELVLGGLDRNKAPTKFDLVITFLAVLEMARMKLILVYQSGVLQTIHVEMRSDGVGEIDGVTIDAPPPPSEPKPAVIDGVERADGDGAEDGASIFDAMEDGLDFDDDFDAGAEEAPEEPAGGDG